MLASRPGRGSGGGPAPSRWPLPLPGSCSCPHPPHFSAGFPAPPGNCRLTIACPCRCFPHLQSLGLTEAASQLRQTTTAAAASAGGRPPKAKPAPRKRKMYEIEVGAGAGGWDLVSMLLGGFIPGWLADNSPKGRGRLASSTHPPSACSPAQSPAHTPSPPAPHPILTPGCPPAGGGAAQRAAAG